MNASKDEVRGYKTYGKRRSLRLRGFDYRTPHAYHLTWGTADRRPVLSDPGIVIPLIEELERETSSEEFLLYAYCFMPDHVQLLLSPEGEQDVVSFIQSYKSKTTRIYWETGKKGRLWQHGFYDRILRQEEDIKQVARYILDNPVRKGLSDDVHEYPFSGSLVFKKEDL
ncbi:transposase [archaeon]|nr:MAG: transposase [archaeon]